jgi:hypothetical protein
MCGVHATRSSRIMKGNVIYDVAEPLAHASYSERHKDAAHGRRDACGAKSRRWRPRHHIFPTKNCGADLRTVEALRPLCTTFWYHYSTTLPKSGPPWPARVSVFLPWRRVSLLPPPSAQWELHEVPNAVSLTERTPDRIRHATSTATRCSKPATTTHNSCSLLQPSS